MNPLRDKRDKRMPRIAGPCGVVIFGVTGDLARKKLMPAIYDLANRGLLPRPSRSSGSPDGTGPTRISRRSSTDAVKEHARTPFRQEVWDRLAEGIRFVQGTFDDERRSSGSPRRWTNWTPNAAPAAITRSTCRFRRTRSRRSASSCKQSGWPAKPEGRWSRVVIEKPFGHDLESARELNAVVNSVFPEESVFRIDHYLGKETVQNILALRFANELYEPIWNTNYVDNVQITMAEDIGLGGRAGYYDGVGAARDVIQNHLLQLLALTAMEEPVSFGPRELQAEKIKILSATQADAAAGPDHRARAVRGRLAGQREGGRAARRGGVLQGLDHRDVRGDHRWRSTPAAGPACRSTCAPENGWAAGSPRSR